MRCLDKQDFELLGNYDTNQASNFMIAFVKCDNDLRDDCKTEEQIDEWMKFKYMFVLENSRRFIPHQFSSDRIIT